MLWIFTLWSRQPAHHLLSSHFIFSSLHLFLLLLSLPLPLVCSPKGAGAVCILMEEKFPSFTLLSVCLFVCFSLYLLCLSLRDGNCFITLLYNQHMIISLHTKGQNVPHNHNWCPVETCSLQKDSYCATHQKVVFLPSTPLSCFFLSFCSELSIVCGDLGVMKHFDVLQRNCGSSHLEWKTTTTKSSCVFMLEAEVTSR